ncbi:MAG: nuclear transport factor 2 family protein, partial [Thermoanaerobaculia bacterium]|nr:nuclear transport factor 2 family protein [Thermoanaerobaculia bacterium]
AAAVLTFRVGSGVAVAAEPAPSFGDLSELAVRLVRAYHAGEVETVRPHLAEELVFRDPGLDQELELAAFLDEVGRMGAGERDRELEVLWAASGDGLADVRGVWRATDAASGGRTELQYSIELDFDTSGERPRVVTWVDDFRPRLRKPVAGDATLDTEHFRIVYYGAEISEAEVTRLGGTFERWYAETARYLGRSFHAGRRLDVNVAGGHEVPYASDPGRDAFILVPARAARREYGFSLVHELTHNLMGLSWLSLHVRAHDGNELASGNRLFDEGFAVFVEEELTGEGPRVWPNFGTETHAAYWQLRREQGTPIWPVLEAEVHREQGDARLGYLAQASFCKYLVETHGLDRFLRLFAADPAAAGEIYGQDLAELEGGWRAFLEMRFGGGTNGGGEGRSERFTIRRLGSPRCRRSMISKKVVITP